MSAILNVQTFPSELTACEIGLDEWQENIHKWESISGDRFNVPKKKATPSTEHSPKVRILMQIQNLDTLHLGTSKTHVHDKATYTPWRDLQSVVLDWTKHTSRSAKQKKKPKSSQRSRKKVLWLTCTTTCLQQPKGPGWSS